jgi:hypothetical protein
MHTAVYNLIVEVTPPKRTGEAVGMSYVSLIMSLAIGSQVLFGILNSSIVGHATSGAGSYPSDSAFTAAFLYIALMCAASFVTLLAIPRTHPSKLASASRSVAAAMPRRV